MTSFKYRPKQTLIILAALTIQTPVVLAQDDENQTVINTIRVSEADAPDITVQIGSGSGTFTPAASKAKTFGGILTGARINYDHTPLAFTPFIEIRALIDGSSNQVIRQSFAGGAHYYLIGGKKRIIKTSLVGDVASSNASSLAFTTRISQDNYSITPTTIGVEILQGGVLNIAIGFTSTWNYSDTSSLTFELSNTLLSFASSVEKATATALDIGFGWRTFL